MSLRLFDLSGKAAIVTGSGRGLGRAIAKGFAACDARVVTSARSADEAGAVAAEIKAAGGEAFAAIADVSRRADCADLVARTAARFGAVDIMVCNAGISISKPTLETSENDWDRVIAVNLTGCFNSAQAAGLQMIRQGTGGAIVVTSSNASLLGFRDLCAYSASKGGVDQMVRTLAVEWAPYGIRVNAINPGWMDHVMRGVEQERDDPRVAEEIALLTPMGRSGRDDEVVGPAIFLASAASSFVTGIVLAVDGGYCAM